MIGKINVGNLWNPLPGYENIYIGRATKHPSVLGNPFIITGSCSREESIAKYEEYLFTQMNQGNKPILREMNRIAKLVRSGKDINLLCDCTHKGLACHGMYIREVILDALTTGAV